MTGAVLVWNCSGATRLRVKCVRCKLMYVVPQETMGSSGASGYLKPNLLLVCSTSGACRTCIPKRDNIYLKPQTLNTLKPKMPWILIPNLWPKIPPGSSTPQGTCHTWTPFPGSSIRSEGRGGFRV